MQGCLHAIQHRYEDGGYTREARKRKFGRAPLLSQDKHDFRTVNWLRYREREHERQRQLKGRWQGGAIALVGSPETLPQNETFNFCSKIVRVNGKIEETPRGFYENDWQVDRWS
jgi:hypothetical protein